MTDKTVTYADLDAIAVIERECSALSCEGQAIELLRRLRAAAEADRPPLPEGWVVYDDGIQGARVYWHQDGDLYHSRSCRDKWHRDITPIRHRLSPLRPTITREDLKRAHISWLRRPGSTLEALRAAFEAAGVVVEP